MTQGPGDAELALQVTAATRRLDGRLVLDRVDLAVPRGTIVGMAGPNGAGKSSLLRAIGGRLRLDSGRIAIAGVDGAQARRTGRLGVVPQDVALYGHLSVRENLALWAVLAGVPRQHLAARVDDGLRWAALVDRADARVHTLSGGMKRRLNLVAGTLHAPALLVLDEPTVGVDAESRSRLYELLRDVRRRGLGVLLVTHDLREAADLCDSVVVLDAGRVAAAGTIPGLVSSLCSSAVEVVVITDPSASVHAALTHEGFVAVADGEWSRSGAGDDVDLARVGRQLEERGVPVVELRLRRPTLAGAVAAAIRRSRTPDEARS